MLEIYPIQDKNEQKDICNKCGMTYVPDAMCYSALVERKLVGACQFRIKDKHGLIVEMNNCINSSDKDALFVMGRAALNFIDLCDIHEAYYAGSLMDEQTLLRIGFRNFDGKWYINLSNFFDHPCEHAQG
ncbi:MAG: hypothetical protein IJC50_07665 [Clostridia bacterium]|nr:hypothetical protein [Clostridia bacterium]